MTPFNEHTLKFYNILSYLILSKKVIHDAVKKYTENLTNAKTNFSKSIVQNGFSLDSADNKRLSDLYSVAIIFRNNKKLVKSIIGQILVVPVLLGFLIIPFAVLMFLYSSFEFKWYDFVCNYFGSFIALILLVLLLFPFLKIITNFEIRIGKTIKNLILFVLLALFCSSGYYFYNSDKVIFISVFTGYLLIYFLFSMLAIEYILESIIDAYYFSYKVQITDALIIESSFRLSLTNWNDAVKIKNLRQLTLTEIERLARLIEKDWSGHIIPGDENTSKWKNRTLIGIATSFRKTKRQLIIPSKDTPNELKESFNEKFEKILKHDLNGLIDEEVPVSRIKRKSKFELLQSIIVAFLPLFISISMKYLPQGIVDVNYIHLSILISCIWLLISALLWLDPNLSDKISAFKSVRDVLKPGSDN